MNAKKTTAAKSSSSSASGGNSGSGSGSAAAARSSTVQTYILNTSSKKFHYPGCYSVNLMSAQNKQEYTGNRADLISQGYEPCKNCNP